MQQVNLAREYSQLANPSQVCSSNLLVDVCPVQHLLTPWL